MDREYRPDARFRDELIEMIVQEMKRIRDKLYELKTQIDQTQLVLDREQQRNADIASELRFVQDNIETIPRQDIRQKYDEALDVRFRVTSMRSQLEKFISIRDNLEATQTLLGQLLNRLQGIDMLSSPAASADDGASLSRGGVNIIRIIQAQEEERLRLSRQMHDGPAQSLTNFILQTEICQRLFDRDPQRAAEELDALRNAANVTFQKVRDFIFDLRPMMLDDLGIVPTMRRYVDSFREKHDINIKLDIIGDERRLQSHREVMIFRALQELMINARDYANASEITIRLDISSDPIKAVIEDNGRGFDANVVLSNEESYTDPRAQNLATIREKFELIGGSVQVFSGETEGTQVKFELPSGE
ncbi:MAG: histidine kinase [Aggregatilineales bacterium]